MADHRMRRRETPIAGMLAVLVATLVALVVVAWRLVESLGGSLG